MLASKNRITYIDLFAGAGGLSEGFAASGYTSIAHVEMDSDACNTLRTREAYYFLKSYNGYNKYIDYLKKKISRDKLYESVPDCLIDSVICETMSEATMPSIFEKIDKAMVNKQISRIDLILGGPPCQAYSTVGRSRKNMDGDPRNTLYKLYLMALKKYHPRMFVFENVPGLLTAGKGRYLNSIIDGFKELNYDLEWKIVNASDYGVLQNRRRIILIGWKRNSGHYYPDLPECEKKYLVKELFSDLPFLVPGEEKSEYTTKEINGFLSDMQIRHKNDVLTWHVARNHTERDRNIYKLVIKTWRNGHKRLKYTDLPDEFITHSNITSFLDRFKVVADDLYATQTMVAHISKDGHYYIHPDERQARSISVREAARIQSFPDDFFFEGPRTAAFRQIGNAVPPRLAKVIAEALYSQFGGSGSGKR